LDWSSASSTSSKLTLSHLHHNFIHIYQFSISNHSYSNNSAVSLHDESISGDQYFHKDNIRAIRFGAKGKLFVSAGDDKTLKILSTESWHCISTVLAEKRVTAVAISNDGLHVCFADKFGLVWVVDLNQTSIDKKPTPLLSHYCSIITSLVSRYLFLLLFFF
jgi:tRNA (guanine-N(7)-)-methyltransferase subunit TRM82